MFYLYLCVSAALIPILDRFRPILRESYSFWLVPVLFVLFFIGFVVLHAAVFIISLMFVRPGKPPKSLGYYHFLAKITLPLVAKLLRIKLKVTGEELIPEDRRFVIIANHLSILDPVVLMAAFPECEFAFIAKQEIVKKMPIVPQFITSQGGVFVDRENTRSGARALIDVITLLKKDRGSVGIFPEGTRSKTGELLPFKPGAVRAAAKAGVPLTAGAIRNTEKVFHNLPFKSTTVCIDILKTYDAQTVKETDSDVLQNEARELIKAKLQEK